MKDKLEKAYLAFTMFDEEIKKRDIVFTSEETKWYTRLERILEENELL